MSVSRCGHRLVSQSAADVSWAIKRAISLCRYRSAAPSRQPRLIDPAMNYPAEHSTGRSDAVVNS